MGRNAQSPLRDESSRLVGAARGAVIPFPLEPPLRDIEKAWIHTCRQHEGRRRLNSSTFEPNSLEHRMLGGVEKLLETGKIGTAHVGVLVMHGERGTRPNLSCEIASQLWTDAMLALEAEVILRPELRQ